MRPIPRLKISILIGVLIAALAVGSASVTWAQEPNDDPSMGGTVGLFMLPRASTLQQGSFAVGAFLSHIARFEGDTSIETIRVTGAYGIKERLVFYANWDLRVGLDRDAHIERVAGGGVGDAPLLNDHPFASNSWQSALGDLRAGVKYKVAGDPIGYDGVAVAGEIKVPTGDADGGVGTGKLDASGFFIASYEAYDLLGLNAMLGGTWRGKPDAGLVATPFSDTIVDGEIQVSSELHYGLGVQIPTRFWIQGIFEFAGTKGKLPGGKDWAVFQAGVRFTHESGFAANIGLNHNPTVVTDDAEDADDGFDLPIRGTEGFVSVTYSTSRPEPVLFQGAAPQPLPPVNRPPTLTCRAERTTVRQGESVRLFATVNDPDGDTVTVRWSAAAGSLNPREGEQVTWSSRGVRPGSGNIAATADDGYGGTDDCTVRVTVEAPPPPPEPTVVTFMCSEFPSGSTRIDNRCKAILDDVALRLRQNPQATAEIIGHSDSTGSEQINMETSLERADNAKAYLAETHGIDASRMTTRGAGAADPVADNSTTEGRAQNRRIEITVTIPPQ